MPGIVLDTYDVNNRTWNDLTAKEQVARASYINTRWAYYDGDHHKWLASPKGAKDDNLTINLCGRSVDKTVEFIGKPECFRADGYDESENAVTANQDALDMLYEQYDDVIPEIVLSGLIAGHSFIKLFYDATGKAAMTALDPTYCVVFWDAMNTRIPLFYRLQWKQGDTNYRQDIVPNTMLATDENALVNPSLIPDYWMIYDYKEIPLAARWQQTNEQKWEYPFAPLVEWSYKKRPHQYYGVSFLHNAIPLNDAINFVASNTARILKHHAHPKTFVFGAEIEAENAVGGIWDNLPETARIESLELQSDLGSSLKMLDMLRGEFFANARVMDNASVKDKLGQLTNFGVRMLFSDMLEMTDGYREAIEHGIGECLLRMMDINGIPLDYRPDAEWENPLPENKLELLQAAKVEKELGTTSERTLTESIGRDPDVEAQRKADEGTQSVDATVNALEKMGNRGLFQ